MKYSPSSSLREDFSSPLFLKNTLDWGCNADEVTGESGKDPIEKPDQSQRDNQTLCDAMEIHSTIIRMSKPRMWEILKDKLSGFLKKNF